MTVFGFVGVVLLIQESATLHVSLPPEEWVTASRICSLESTDDVQSVEKLSPINSMIFPHIFDEAWTRRRVNYSRWTAFIGCSITATTGHKEEKTTGSLDECVSYCSQLNTKYLAYKDMRCACFDLVNRIDENLKDCRQQCNNDSKDFACSGGSSTMIFEFVDIQESSLHGTKYAPKECIAEANKNPGQYKIMDCASSNGIVCSSSANSPSGFNWFEYQKECLERGIHILYGKNFTDVKKNVNLDYYWTPIFKTQISLEASVVLSAAVLLMIGTIVWCIVYRRRFRQRLYTEFLQVQSNLYAEFGGRYDYITDYDVMNMVTQHSSIQIGQYGVPRVSDDLRSKGQNGGNESDYLEPESGYLEPSVYQNMFWRKVLANAKPSEVQKFLNRKNQNIDETGERGNISSHGNKTVDETSRQTACTFENNYDLPSEIESCDL